MKYTRMMTITTKPVFIGYYKSAATEYNFEELSATSQVHLSGAAIFLFEPELACWFIEPAQRAFDKPKHSNAMLSCARAALGLFPFPFIALALPSSAYECCLSWAAGLLKKFLCFFSKHLTFNS